MKLENPQLYPGFIDERNCLVFWARPPLAVRTLCAKVQQKLLQVAPNLRIQPPPDLHMTVLEVAHSRTPDEIDGLLKPLLQNIGSIVNYTLGHRARLLKPMVSYDAQALALSYLPAVGDATKSEEEDAYTYHHLRRDVFDEVRKTGTEVASRYVVQSAHLTIGRFITKADFESEDRVDPAKMLTFVERIDSINEWLRNEYWPTETGLPDRGEWIVGQEKGLECRKGALWYGDGGHTVVLGKGF